MNKSKLLSEHTDIRTANDPNHNPTVQCRWKFHSIHAFCKILLISLVKAKEEKMFHNYSVERHLRAAVYLLAENATVCPCSTVFSCQQPHFYFELGTWVFVLISTKTWATKGANCLGMCSDSYSSIFKGKKMQNGLPLSPKVQSLGGSRYQWRLLRSDSAHE